MRKFQLVIAVLVLATSAFSLQAAQFKNPIQAAKDAYNKNKAQQQQQPQQQGQQQTTAAAGQQWYWICEGKVSDQKGSTVLLVSKPFAAPAGLSYADLSTGKPEWEKTVLAWQRYFLTKYDPAQEQQLDQSGYFTRGAAAGPLGTCRPGDQAAAQGVHDRDVKGGSVEQDWVYTADQASVSTAASTPAAAQQPAQSAPSSSTCSAPATNPGHSLRALEGASGCPQAGSTPAQATPAPAAAAPAPAGAAIAAAPAAPKMIWGVCAARADTATYFSEPFEAKQGTRTQWSKAFRDMLVAKYQSDGAGGLTCSMAETFGVAQKLGEQQHNTAPPKRPKVETGWKFQ